MADQGVLETYGQLAETKGYVDYTAGISSGAGLSRNAQAMVVRNQEREAKNKAVKDNINNMMSQMSDNVDLTAYTAEEQKGIRNFITSERSRYAYAANEIAKIDDASSPEYQYYADIMNEVNNSFQNLKTQLDGYKQDKVSFIEGNESGLFSAGNENFDTAASIYGLNEPTTFVIGEGGNIGFGVGDQVVSYKDFEKPFAKDFKTVNAILDKSNTLFNNHQELNQHSERALKAELLTYLNNPKTLQSLLSSDFNELGIEFPEGLVYDPSNIDGVREQVMETIMNGYRDVARQGKAEYDARRVAKAGKGRSASTTTPRQEPAEDGTSSESYTDDLKGRAVAKIDKMDQFGLPETIKGTKFTPIVIQPIEIGSQEQKDRDMTDEEVKANNENVGKRIYVYTQNGQQAFKTYDQLVEWAS